MGGVNSTSANSNNWIETAQLVHKIATQIIDFLSHIEDFQKTLWLKKKFVLTTDYCITLDRIPEELYPEIAQNTAQWQEWQDLFSIHEIEPNLFTANSPALAEVPSDSPLPAEGLGGVNFLKANPNLIIDTCHFNQDFKDRLLSHFDDLDNQTDGLLIHGENFQALNLIKTKYRESIKTIYIDPPYNTGGDDFIYKNTYQHSSWLSLMADRITISHELLFQEGAIFTSIDDNEIHHLRILMNEIFEESNFTSQFFWMRTATPPSLSKIVRRKMEPLICYRKSKKLKKLFGGQTEGGDMPLLNETNTIRQLEFPKDAFHRVNLQDGIYKPQNYGRIRLVEEVEVKNGQFLSNLIMEGRFKWKQETVQDEIETGTRFHIKSDKFSIRYERNEKNRVKVPSNLITQKECQVGTNEDGNTELEDMIGSDQFDYPKPTSLIKYLINMNCKGSDTVLDFFAGSGTTAHATINLNRQDNGKRKYILVEMGHHFNTVLKPRIKKAIYAEKWKNAKPVSRNSLLSHMIKYQHLESYEDALNNIAFTQRENTLFTEHHLSYLLGSETCESQTFLNSDNLQNPFDYQLENFATPAGSPTDSPPAGGLGGGSRIDIPETFNYLLGLKVKTQQCLYDNDRRYLVYHGTTEQKTTVIIWRETKDWEKQDWERDYQFIEKKELIKNADEVYINTDSIIPEAKPIAPVFKRLMFSE